MRILEFEFKMTSLKSSKIVFVRYEDLALDMIGYGRKIYKFIGMNVTEELEKSLLDLNQGQSGKVSSSYTTSRNKNFNQIVNSWRLDKILTVRRLLMQKMTFVAK